MQTYYDFNIYQIDIKIVYLNADLEEELYREIYERSEDYGKIVFWKLEKVIYGLKWIEQSSQNIEQQIK